MQSEQGMASRLCSLARVDTLLAVCQHGRSNLVEVAMARLYNVYEAYQPLNNHHLMVHELAPFQALGNKSGSFCEAVNCERSEQEGKFLFAMLMVSIWGMIALGFLEMASCDPLPTPNRDEAERSEARE